MTDFETEWMNKDESENFSQKHDQEIIKVTKRGEVESEIKAVVMEILKEELKNLKSAVERESGKKGKGAKGKKGGKGGGKKKVYSSVSYFRVVKRTRRKAAKRVKRKKILHLIAQWKAL